MSETTAGLRIFERVQQIRECGEVDAASMPGGGHGETEREVCLADAGRSE